MTGIRITDEQKEHYLRGGGWLRNDRGWWHPPHCTASLPLFQAHTMAIEDESHGLRMTEAEVAEYLKE